MAKSAEFFWQSADRTASLMQNAASRGSWFGNIVFDRGIDALGRIYSSDPQTLVRRLESTRPISEANIGRAAIEQGSQNDDPQLITIGEHYVARGIEIAATDPRVPYPVYDEVVYMARKINDSPLPASIPLDPQPTLEV